MFVTLQNVANVTSVTNATNVTNVEKCYKCNKSYDIYNLRLKGKDNKNAWQNNNNTLNIFFVEVKQKEGGGWRDTDKPECLFFIPNHAEPYWDGVHKKLFIYWNILYY